MHPLVVLSLFSRVSSIMSSIHSLVASILATTDYLFNTSRTGMISLPHSVFFPLLCVFSFSTSHAFCFRLKVPEILSNLRPPFFTLCDVRNFHIHAAPNNSVPGALDLSPFPQLFCPFTNVEELFLPHRQQVASQVKYMLDQAGLLPNACVMGVTVTPPT